MGTLTRHLRNLLFLRAREDEAMYAVARAKPEDAERIEEIRVSAWRAAYQGIMDQAYLDGLDPHEHCSRLSARLPSFTFDLTMTVALDSRLCVGFSSAGRPRYACGPGTLELYALYVDPDRWSRGVGKALLNQALFDAGRFGCSCLELWCIKQNDRSRRFYEAASFQLTAAERTTTHLTGQPLTEVQYRVTFL